MRRIHRLTFATVVLALFPASVFADDAPETLELSDGRFRVALEWAEEPAGELWIQDLGGEGGMFGATDGGEAARLEVAGILAGKVRARYRVDERVAAFVVTDIPSGVTRRIEVSGGGVLELDPAAFAAEAAAKVTPVLDTARAVSAFVGPNGGVVTATDAGGVAFSLTLPKGALLTSQEITLTPLLGLGGFPFTPGFVAAVEMEPEGLRLWKLARLKIEPPAPVPLAERVVFGFRPANQQLFLLPALKGSILALPVTQLGGLGVGRGTGAEVEAQWKRVPSHPSDRFHQRLAQAVAVGERTAAAEGIGWEKGGSTCKDITSDAFVHEFQGYIAKHLKAATKSCTGYRALVRESSTWVRLLDEWKHSSCSALDKAIQQLKDAQKKGLVRCFNESFDKCVKKNTDEAHELLGAYRILKASGWASAVDANKIGKCVRFDLNFLSEMTITTPEGQKELLGVKASAIPLRHTGAASLASGSGVTAWDQAKCLSPPSTCDPVATCTNSPNKPGIFAAAVELKGSKLEVEVAAGSEPYEQWLSIGSSAPTYKRTITCDGTKVEDFDQHPLWFQAYWHLHVDELRPVVAGILWLSRGLSSPNPGEFQKIYKRPGSLGVDQLQEDSSLYLSHRPQP